MLSRSNEWIRMQSIYIQCPIRLFHVPCRWVRWDVEQTNAWRGSTGRD